MKSLMSETPYIESEAFLIAMNITNAEEHDQLVEYLRKNFTYPGELQALKAAARRLVGAIEDLDWQS
jgi:hypothetical protein